LLPGRSPTYILRQLLAFRTGARSSESSRSMQPVVERLGIDDMIAIAAQVADHRHAQVRERLAPDTEALAAVLLGRHEWSAPATS
jgi:cytochrome c553